MTHSAPPPGFASGEKTDRFALVFVFLLHVVATCILLPPWEVLRREPLRTVDYPVHTHRVHMYRQGLLESGLPWGYDPAVSAGTVTSPLSDIGAKSIQVLSVFLPFLEAGAVVRLFVFLAVLAIPLGSLMACRHLGLPTGTQVWVAVVILIPAWLYENLVGYFYWGLVGFAAASYFLPYVLALFLVFFARPSLRTYVAFCLAAACLFLLHVLGPVVLVPSMALFSLAARPLAWRWRMAVLLAPLGIGALNAFWLIPFFMARNSPRPLWQPIPGLVTQLHMTYMNWPQLVESLTPFRVAAASVGLSLAVYGFAVLKRHVGRRVVGAFAIAAVVALFLKFAGSFLPVFRDMQPTRFLVPAFALLTLPVGTALFTLVKRLRLPAGLSAAGLALFVAAGASVLGKPEGLPLPPSPDLLAEFVASRTEPDERLLIQSAGGYEPRIFPLAFGREVIGNTFPSVHDPAQFLHRVLWGKPMDVWTPGELRRTLERWGVVWALAHTEEARALFAEALGSPGEAVGRYRAFRWPPSGTRFLIGTGRVAARVNRLELTEIAPEEGLVVLKYRYHPAWRTSTGLQVHQYPIPEDAAGFIALEDPPEKVTLYFDPWEMLHAPWPP